MTDTSGLIEERVGHVFTDPDLRDRALTHRSLGSHNNERLEFLGDAVLGLFVAEQLYTRFPEVEEGDLSRLRATLVNRDTLAEVAASIGLGDFLKLGSGERKSGGRRRDSILADALEALIGAVYLDGGYEAAKDVVNRLFSDRIAAVPDPHELKDPKTRLQEYLQARGLERPHYEVLEESGAAHARQFRVRCRVPDYSVDAEGSGRSRRKAEQSAATAMLEALGGE